MAAMTVDPTAYPSARLQAGRGSDVPGGHRRIQAESIPGKLHGRLAVSVGDAWCEADDWPCDWPCFLGYWVVRLGVGPFEKYLKLWPSLPADTREHELMLD